MTNKVTAESDSEINAIHHAGIPAVPPVSIAVSLPPPSSAAIKRYPHSPKSLVVQHVRGPGSEIVTSL